MKDSNEESGNEIEYENEDHEMEDAVQEQKNPEAQQSKADGSGEIQSKVKIEEDLVGIAQVSYLVFPNLFDLSSELS